MIPSKDLIEGAGEESKGILSLSRRLVKSEIDLCLNNHDLSDLTLKSERPDEAESVVEESVISKYWGGHGPSTNIFLDSYIQPVSIGRGDVPLSTLSSDVRTFY